MMASELDVAVKSIMPKSTEEDFIYPSPSEAYYYDLSTLPPGGVDGTLPSPSPTPSTPGPAPNSPPSPAVVCDDAINTFVSSPSSFSLPFPFSSPFLELSSFICVCLLGREITHLLFGSGRLQYQRGGSIY